MSQANPANSNHFAGPAWDTSAEYQSLEHPGFQADLQAAQQLSATIKTQAATLAPLIERATKLTDAETATAVETCKSIFASWEQANRTIANLNTYVSCLLSVDAKHDAAKVLASRIAVLWAELDQAGKPWTLFLTLAPDSLVEMYLNGEKSSSHRFTVMQARRLRDQLLSLPEEDLISGLGVDGHSAWGVLYDNISGALTAKIKTPAGEEALGLAAASARYENPDPSVRKAAYDAINAAWTSQEESCTAMLNAITGWRLELYRRRSKTTPVHYLDPALHDARIKRATLDAMMAAVSESQSVGQRAVRARASALGLSGKSGPWDLFAPCANLVGLTRLKPSDKDTRLTFAEALNLISDAFGSIDPEMGEFVRMMQRNNWIEGRIGNTKRPGAYCTGFAKSRTPRVYMTYTGGMKDVMTLAHELGHAFHSWVMRDLPWFDTHYPMTLAETASIFGETVVNGALTSKATSAEDLLKVAWSDSSEAEAFLCNIPARFKFECELFERRSKANLTASELREMMTKAWRSCYGDSLAEMNDMFWASKLHFYITDLSFYNFPYTFGYLFALGVYAQKQKLGKNFYPAYVSLLRDTGRMSAEDVAQRHLGADLTKPDFWRESIAIARTKVERLENLIGDLK